MWCPHIIKYIKVKLHRSCRQNILGSPLWGRMGGVAASRSSAPRVEGASALYPWRSAPAGDTRAGGG